MIHVKTFIEQLIDAKPDGIRLCRMEDESLLTVLVPRKMLKDAMALPNVPERGVYYLIEDQKGKARCVSAGQTVRGVLNLSGEELNNNSWNVAIFFLDNDWVMSNEVLDGLESKACNYVHARNSQKAKRIIVSESCSDPYKEEVIEKLHETIQFRLAVLGYKLKERASVSDDSEIIFHTRRKGTNARGYYNSESDKFVVLAGSLVDLTKAVSANEKIIALRKKLFGDKQGVVELVVDQEFSTPSAAAQFVYGGTANGWTEWVTDSGKMLDEVYRD